MGPAGWGCPLEQDLEFACTTSIQPHVQTVSLLKDTACKDLGL